MQFGIFFELSVPRPFTAEAERTGRLLLQREHLDRAGGKVSCQLAGALSQLSPDGEFGEICEIRGGTGTYQGATGHLQLIGESVTSGTPILGLKGAGNYLGTINTPGNPSS